ncbi:MAG TPA: SulP family inorganic anion transporter [Leptospiraceae bacterium]|nr:cyclic nucleotide-binding domain-containing protein [Leptospirales bacterium]HMX55110.1 SulP family inorganic anion transporter [Leptospiraceae bacterium]HMZ37081.1 SulP family inorganic anion transporter [Leptospiraceae bacterium]HNE21621.1 SulP family inorganic anion transporter [Leptospiraceae bacterium]HNN58998.1 SulP family inorganic anion transporter [Leptospiraceae bacterium]
MRAYVKSGDVWGGLAAMLVALPQSIAFGITAFSALDPGLLAQGAMAGIIGAIAVGLVAPIFGGTPRLISSPCAPAAAFLAGLASEGWMKSAFAGGPGPAIALVILVTFSAGLLQLLFAFLGGGKVIKYIPYPVVAGYMSSVGIIIVIGQIPRILGSTPLAEFEHGVSPVHLAAAIIATATIAAMFIVPRITSVMPAPIFGLGAGLVAYGLFALAFPEYRSLEGNVLVVGPLHGEFSFDVFFSRFRSYATLQGDYLREAVLAGGTLAVILSIDTLKSCVVVDTVTRSRSDSNRELLGQGLGNITSAFCGGLAGAGTLGATLVNVSSGGVTRISGVLAGLFALIALVFLSPVFAWVPIPALSGILIVVGLRMIDWKLAALLRRKATALDFFVILTVIGVALKFSLMAAAGAGVALSALFFMREQMRGSVVHKKTYGSEISSKRSRLPAEQKVIRASGQRAVLYELQGSLFFGNTDRLFTLIHADLEESQFVIISMRRVQSIDSTAIHMLLQINTLLEDRGGRLFITDLPESLEEGQAPEEFLHDAGLLGPASGIVLFDEFYYALEWVEDYILKENDLYHSHLERPLELGEIEVFENVDAEDLPLIQQCLESRSFSAGNTIFSSGDTSDNLFFIRRGVVRIMLPINSHRQHHLASFGRGDFFGDMAFVDHEVRSAHAIAETDCDLYSLSRNVFDSLLAKDPQIGRQFYENLVRVLAHRFRAVHLELRSLE